ncbi:MAG: prephenate dehydrogenase/arogenate dehydrogenase family protein [Candidatus Rokubacteria bacterium]|nr:prephenate dehydrogenase/arogenate dehydrogenase family protein [Candidatus Rokubacteria bacterium]
MIRRLAIVGVGLLGGSVAKAARAESVAREIVGIGRDTGRLAPAVQDGTLDRAEIDLARGIRDADFVVLAAPVQTLERLLPSVATAVTADAVVTDVGSTKAALVAAAQRAAARTPFAFVGSHPMAGSEQSGYGAARADLFRGATVIVTPGDTTEPRALKATTMFWEGLGARVSTLDPETHDRVVAAISHLPHLVADALVDAVARFEPAALDFAARGFRDATRIAASDPDVWREIFLANRGALRAGLAEFRRALDELEALVASGDEAALTAALARIRGVRRGLP